MNFTTLFRLKENLNLDKKTLVTLRWIALIGQFAAINFVYFALKLEFPIYETYAIIFVGVITNIYLQLVIKTTLLKDLYSGLFLVYDLFQLGILLYLTGGIHNPFSFLFDHTSYSFLYFFKYGYNNHFRINNSRYINNYYFLPFTIARCRPIICVSRILFIWNYYFNYNWFNFFKLFWNKICGETKKRSDALNKLQLILSKEYELESLGGQAAAAAHSLGTPLATISVVAKELKKEIGENSKYTEDLDLLISQTKRCSEILKQISQKQIVDDKFLSLTTAEDLLEDIIKSFNETTDKKINLVVKKDFNKFKFERTPETVYGIRNFIGNSIKFSKNLTTVSVESDKDTLSIIIDDDGLGFPNDILDILGEPYIKSKIPSSRSGLGLGTFLGKTLLNRKNAEVYFKNKGLHNGARVIIKWKLKDLNTNF